MRNEERSLVFTGARAAACLTPLMLAGAAVADPWGGGWHDGWGWGHMLFGTLMMILIGVALVVLVATGIRWAGTRSTPGAEDYAPGARAVDILEQRYARGEIDTEEFEERRRRILEGSSRETASQS